MKENPRMRTSTERVKGIFCKDFKKTSVSSTLSVSLRDGLTNFLIKSLPSSQVRRVDSTKGIIGMNAPFRDLLATLLG